MATGSDVPRVPVSTGAEVSCSGTEAAEGRSALVGAAEDEGLAERPLPGPGGGKGAPEARCRSMAALIGALTLALESVVRPAILASLCPSGALPRSHRYWVCHR